MFNPRTFENSRPDGFPVLEVVSDGSDDRPERERPHLFVPLQRTDLSGEIVGPVAALSLRQRFGFSTAQFSKPIEAVYRFPLPGDAAVTGVRVRFGEVEIVAALAERERAEQTYQEARAEGRQAALLTRESPDVFTLQVAGIRPDQEVAIQTDYAQLARPDGTGWSLRIPLTTVPRFVRGDERGSSHAEGQPLAVLRDPGHRFALDLTLDAAEGASSPTHTLNVDAAEGRLRVTLRDGEVVPDRDCVLTWRPSYQADGPELQVLRHDDNASGESHFLALVVPPAVNTASEAVAREAILLIDHSGSMDGPKWAAADWAVQNLLAGLTPGDTFNLGLFHNTTRWFARQPVRADERTVKQARDFLLQHKDSGGTELGVALEQALGQARDRDRRARHVLIVTDAQVSDAGRILTLVEREADRADRRRIDVLCIDAAPNSGLANEVSERGGGLARFLTSDPAENDIASALDEVLADWAAPVLHDLTLQVDRTDVQAAGRRVVASGTGLSEIDLGDLPSGRSIWVAGRIGPERRGRSDESPTFRLLANGQEVATVPARSAGAGVSHPAIAALFGARRVLDIELAQSSGVDLDRRLRQLGYDARELAESFGLTDEAPVYAENARQLTTDALKRLLVRESLKYGIACSATAFVATRTEAGEKVAGTVAVANALADGWSSDFLTMGRVALASPMQATGQVFFRTMAAMSPSRAPAAPSGFLGDVQEMRTAAPPPAPGGSGSAGGGFGLAELASAPLDAARNLARRLRKRGSDGDSGRPGADDAARPSSPGGARSVFSGVPTFSDGEAVLFDSRTSSARLRSGGTLSRLSVRLGGGASGALDPGLTLLLFVDDLTAPRAQVRLADLLRQGGERPLNVQRSPEAVVRLVLHDPAGAWAAGAPTLEVFLL